MTDIRPSFLTGANAKIVINGRTVAFATDISYRIQVNHASPRVLGRFEPEVHQPLTYDVSGSFTIIRYTQGVKNELNDAPNGFDNRGNGVGQMNFGTGIMGGINSALGLPVRDGQPDGRTDEAFVPGRMFQSKQFDIEIFQKIDASGPVKQDAFARLTTLIRTANLNGGRTTNGTVGQCQVAKLEACRFTSSDFVLSKRGLAQQRFNFVCRYAHEDTFLAAKSGVGQEFS